MDEAARQIERAILAMLDPEWVSADDLKVCRKCGNLATASHCSKTEDGLWHYCSQCEAARVKAYKERKRNG